MRVFVPMADEWDSGVPFPMEALVPYRAGLPVWREPRLREDEAGEPPREVPRAA
jgi:hypothetical protein